MPLLQEPIQGPAQPAPADTADTITEEVSSHDIIQQLASSPPNSTDSSPIPSCNHSPPTTSIIIDMSPLPTTTTSSPNAAISSILATPSNPETTNLTPSAEASTPTTPVDSVAYARKTRFILRAIKTTIFATVISYILCFSIIQRMASYYHSIFFVVVIGEVILLSRFREKRARNIPSRPRRNMEEIVDDPSPVYRINPADDEVCFLGDAQPPPEYWEEISRLQSDGIEPQQESQSDETRPPTQRFHSEPPPYAVVVVEEV